MPPAASRLRRVHVVVATSVSLVLIVAGVLAWLGWRVSTQEAELTHQTSMLRLNAAADSLLEAFQC